LSFLAAQRLPVTLDTIAHGEQIYGEIDAATVYRSLMLLTEVDFVRQLSLSRMAQYFALNVPGETCSYLVCRCCGSILELGSPKGIWDLEEEVRTALGYVAVYHELELRGVCPACQERGRWPLPAAKLPVISSSKTGQS
jgi:Fe2+ or Zn2+ uptake regulation protein